jgi:amidohydrolase
MSVGKVTLCGVLLLAVAAAHSAAAQTDDLKARAAARIDESAALLQDYVRYLNANPETGFDLPRAADHITAILERAGFEVERGIHGTLQNNAPFFMEHAFIARIEGRKPGPKVGLMVEYDALPVIGHGCQHDLSGAWSVGAGLALAALMPELEGTLYLFGTPAEEGIVDHAGGKVIMLDRIRQMDAALMIHGSETTTDGAENILNLNREALEVVFLGKEASPNSAHHGINALDANVLFWNAVNAYRPHIKDGAAIYGIITDGGQTVNTIPGRSASRFLIRTNDHDYLLELVERVTEIAKGVAMAMGATVEVNVTANRYVSMVPSQTLAQAYRKNAEALGLSPESPRITGSGGSSDMGNVSRVVPSIHPFLMSRLSGGSHTRAAAEQSVSEFGLSTVTVGAKTLAMTAIDVFTGAVDVTAMRTELEASLAPAPDQGP